MSVNESGRVEWTGERFLPWVDNAALRLEHLHRYGLALDLARGRRVLDLGCGEGYGSALLAEAAALTIGLDVDPVTVAHARGAHGRKGLHLLTASASGLPLGQAVFDLVVAFEVIEHVPDPEALLGEVVRVLAPDGLLLLSTPNPEAEQHRGSGPNPYHFREFSPPELQQMLHRHFSHVALWGQRVVIGSSVFPCGAGSSPQAVTTLVLDGSLAAPSIEAGGEREAVYSLALASKRTLRAALGESLLVERIDSLARERRSVGDLIVRKDRHAGELAEHCHKLEELVRQKDAALADAARHCRALEAELAKGMLVRLRERFGLIRGWRDRRTRAGSR